MKLVCIAGPFRDHYTGPDGRYNFWKQDQNVNDAAGIALKVWAMGAAVICPHLNTRPFQGALTDDVWLNGDLEMIRRCDYLVLIPGWEGSEGTCNEKAFAHGSGLIVFEWDSILHDARAMTHSGVMLNMFLNDLLK